MKEKCKITNEECTLHPSGLEDICIDGCPDAIRFMEDLKNLSKEEDVVRFLEDELLGIEDDKSFLARCFKVVIKEIEGW